MTKIFVVVGLDSLIEGQENCLMGARTSLKSARGFVNELTDEISKLQLIGLKLQDIMNEWKEENPAPVSWDFSDRDSFIIAGDQWEKAGREFKTQNLLKFNVPESKLDFFTWEDGYMGPTTFEISELDLKD